MAYKMKVSNTIIVVVFLAFLMGFLSGVTGMFLVMSVDSETEKSVLREHKFSNSIVSGEFDVNSESPEMQRTVENLIQEYVGILNAIFNELPDDVLRKHALGAFAEMMLMLTGKMAEITTELKSYEPPHKDAPAAPKVPKKRGISI